MACSYYLFQQTCGTCEYFIARGRRMMDKEVKLDKLGRQVSEQSGEDHLLL